MRQQLGLNSHPRIAAGAFLKRMYAKGRLRATDVEEGLADDASGNAGAGQTSRSQRKHASRKLSQRFEKNCALRPTYKAEGVFWDRARCCKINRPMSILPIHETLDTVITADRLDSWCSFDDSQAGFRTALCEWGERVDVDVSDGVVAVALWGDSAPHAKRDSIYLLQFTILTGTCRKRFWISAFSKRSMCQCGCSGRCTFEVVFEVIAWSFRALLAGTYPAVDHRGNPFPPGSWRAEQAGKALTCRGACISMRGDWAWHKQSLGLQGWQGEGDSQRMCWLCGAGFTPACYCYDFSLDAQWRNSRVDMAAFWSSVYRREVFVSAIWDIPGFAIGGVRADWMHTVCLGILQYLTGNVMHDLFKELGGTRKNPTRAISLLENIIGVMCRHLGSDRPFHTLTIGMIRVAGDPPRMKLKAAEGRHFLPILRAMLEHCFERDTEYTRQRFHCVDYLCKCYEELKAWSAETSRLTLATYARRHLILYQNLGRLCGSDLRWRVYPKHHLFIHVAESSQGNPACQSQRSLHPREIIFQKISPGLPFLYLPSLPFPPCPSRPVPSFLAPLATEPLTTSPSPNCHSSQPPVLLPTSHPPRSPPQVCIHRPAPPWGGGLMVVGSQGLVFVGGEVPGVFCRFTS